MAVKAHPPAAQRQMHVLEFPIEAADMGIIFPAGRAVNLLFASAEKAAQFVARYPSIRQGGRYFAVGQNGDVPTVVNIELGNLPASDIIAALHQLIIRRAEGQIQNPYRYRYFAPAAIA